MQHRKQLVEPLLAGMFRPAVDADGYALSHVKLSSQK
jgi:hypothetical protein